MDTGTRVAVVGAGVWGLSTAVALVERGLSSVDVYERREPGDGASGRAAGLLSTHLREEVNIRFVQETRDHLRRLMGWGREHDVPAAPNVFREAGNVTMAGADHVQLLRRMHDRVKRAGIAVDWLDGDALGHRWPLLDTDDLAGIFCRDDGELEAGDLVALLAARARAGGAKIRVGASASLDIGGGACRGVRVDGATKAADVTVLAAGAHAKRLLAQHGLPLSLKPYRTQVAQLEFAPPQDFPIAHDTSQGVYWRADGPTRIIIGDGTEHVESDPDHYNESADTVFIEKIADAFSRRWAGGDAAKYRTGWAGLCVGTPDGNPLVGAYPNVDGLVLATGDNGFGLMRCLAIGDRVARCVVGEPFAERADLDPMRLDLKADFPIREGFQLG